MVPAALEIVLSIEQGLSDRPVAAVRQKKHCAISKEGDAASAEKLS